MLYWKMKHYNISIPVPALAETAFPAHGHSHDSCKKQALAHARAICNKEGLRLTENRETVLRILLEHHKPLGAYEIIEHFDWKGRKPAPAQIYRAIRFLEGIGLVHRLESRNTYFACYRAGEECRQAFLVCDGCNSVAELPAASLFRSLDQTARSAGFEPCSSLLEVRGLCPSCRPPAS